MRCYLNITKVTQEVVRALSHSEALRYVLSAGIADALPQPKDMLFQYIYPGHSVEHTNPIVPNFICIDVTLPSPPRNQAMFDLEVHLHHYCGLQIENRLMPDRKSERLYRMVDETQKIMLTYLIGSFFGDQNLKSIHTDYVGIRHISKESVFTIAVESARCDE